MTHFANKRFGQPGGLDSKALKLKPLKKRHETELMGTFVRNA